MGHPSLAFLFLPSVTANIDFHDSAVLFVDIYANNNPFVMTIDQCSFDGGTDHYYGMSALDARAAMR